MFFVTLFISTFVGGISAGNLLIGIGALFDILILLIPHIIIKVKLRDNYDID